MAEYIVLKKYHVNVREWRFLLSVLTDKTVHRVQNNNNREKEAIDRRLSMAKSR